MELIFLVVLIFIITIYKPIIKGRIGEAVVSRRLQRLEFSYYHLLEDIILSKGNSTSQIDHIVICPKGIIVIETKNYKGWIYGSEKQKDWTQVIYKKRSKFLNPIIQNMGHIKAIKENLTGYNDIEYYSVVVIAGSGEFKTWDQVSTPVIYPSSINTTLVNLKSGRVQLSPSAIEDIYNQLFDKMRTDKGARKEHVRNIKSGPATSLLTILEEPELVEKCPTCGGRLILRNGKYGKFWGCKGYPKCKYTKEFDGLKTDV